MFIFTRTHLFFFLFALMLTPLRTEANDDARYQSLTAELRCLVCQNESLADSDAPLAKDLRQTIRNKMTQGESDQQIIHFLTERYGEFILFKPSMSKKNSLLWFGPIIIFLTALIALLISIRAHQRNVQQKTALSEQEKKQLEQLLK
jgi:cytochrome c-type biogenesis protein CcmH